MPKTRHEQNNNKGKLMLFKVKGGGGGGGNLPPPHTPTFPLNVKQKVNMVTININISYEKLKTADKHSDFCFDICL